MKSGIKVPIPRSAKMHEEGLTVEMWFYIQSLPTGSGWEVNLYQYNYPTIFRFYFNEARNKIFIDVGTDS